MTRAPSGPVASVGPTEKGSKTGAVVSSTRTVNVPVAVLSWASVAEQVTVVSPRPKVVPLAGSQVTVTSPSTMSAAGPTP